MAIQDVSVKVIDVSPGVITVEIGPWRVDLTKELLQDYMDGSLHDPLDTVLRNLAIRLKLSGAVLTNKASIVSALNAITFKAVM